MSLTIKPIETSGAALAALCIAGAVSPANATTVPVFIAYNSGVTTDIFIDSATPQFSYDSYKTYYYPCPYCYEYSATFNTLNSGGIAASGNAGTNAINPGLSYAPGSTQVSYKGVLQGTGYVQLAFLNGSNVQEYGYASFDKFGDLTAITGDITSVTLQVETTPLPAAWALFVGGVGMLGLVAQRRRRHLKLAA